MNGIQIRITRGTPIPDPPPLPLPEGMTLWQVLHDQELWDKGIRDPRDDRDNPRDWLWRRAKPEVFLFDGSHRTLMVRWVQEISFGINPGMTPDKWRALYSGNVAFTNQGAGFGDDRHLRDYINRIDLDSNEYPRYDQSRVCGGATLAGTVSGNWLEVDTMKANQPVTLEWLLMRPWLMFNAVTVAISSTPSQEIVGDFPQGPRPVRIPLITTTPVRYPLAWMRPVNSIADPYHVG